MKSSVGEKVAWVAASIATPETFMELPYQATFMLFALPWFCCACFPLTKRS